MHFEGMVYQQKVGIPMGTNCAMLIADLFLFKNLMLILVLLCENERQR